MKSDNAVGMAGMVFFIICMLSLVTWVGVFASTINTNWELDRDINGWLDRAQVANNPIDMQNYLVKCRDGMISYGLTTGYGVAIFPTPEEYMPYVMEVLDSAITRCDYIKGLPENSTTYQVALDDLRGNIRELDLHANGKYWADNVLTLVWASVGWLVAVLFGFFALFTWDN
jgi:hypothetical protein